MKELLVQTENLHARRRMLSTSAVIVPQPAAGYGPDVYSVRAGDNSSLGFLRYFIVNHGLGEVVGEQDIPS